MCRRANVKQYRVGRFSKPESGASCYILVHNYNKIEKSKNLAWLAGCLEEWQRMPPLRLSRGERRTSRVFAFDIYTFMLKGFKDQQYVD